MKKIYMKQIARIFPVIFFSMVLILVSDALQAQGPPPPPPPSGHESGNNQGPMGAPVDGGMAIFAAFAAGYGIREWRKSRK